MQDKDSLNTFGQQANEKRSYLLIKRAFDLIASVSAFVILLPALIIIAAIIFIDDPHASPIFAQERVGKDGKTFKFLKFRTMYADAELRLGELKLLNEKDGPMFKIKDDPRITKVGHFLRKSSIDELMQLVNVIMGDMSIVGPRPPLPREYEKFTDYQKQKVSVVPGLTCLWQIKPGRDSVPFEDWIELDLKYIRERNVLLDLKIILATFAVIFRMDGE